MSPNFESLDVKALIRRHYPDVTDIQLTLGDEQNDLVFLVPELEWISRAKMEELGDEFPVVPLTMDVFFGRTGAKFVLTWR